MAGFEDEATIIGESSSANFKVEVLAYKRLIGSQDLRTAQLLHDATRAGMRLKFVRITLNNSEAVLEAGALYYMKGHIQIRNQVGGSGGLGGLAKGFASKILTNETMFRPVYKGSGVIYLEPSFGHFLIYRLEPKQALIVDKGMFYCAEGSVGVSVAIQKNISSGLMGGEGWFQTKVVGPGICVFSSPVPPSEIVAYDLQNDKLQVDGNFALMRTEGVRFSVQKSAKGLFAAGTTGEGMLQTFEGSGRVWLAPTQAVYDRLANPYSFGRMVGSQGSSHTKT